MQFIIKIHRVLTYSLAAIPLVPQQWVTYLIACWGLFSLPLLDVKKYHARNVFLAILLVTPFFLLLIHAWVSQGKVDWFAVEKAHSFWVFPLCFIFLKKEVPTINTTIFHRVLAYSMVTLALITSIYFVLFGFKITVTEQHDFIFRYRNEINHLVHIHPTYISLMAVYSLIFLFQSAPQYNVRLNGLHLIVSIILLAFIFLLSSRLVWIAGTAVFVVLILWNKQISIRWKMGMFAVLASLVAVMFAVNPRTLEFFSFKTDPAASNSLKVRSVINTCSISLIPKAFPLGLGPSDTQKKLNACYGDELVFKTQSFNTHNQYLDYLLSLGMPGILFLLLILLAGFIIAYKDKNQLFMSFLLLSSIVMLGENILSRQSGVVFFCLMFSLFARQHVLQANK